MGHSEGAPPRGLMFIRLHILYMSFTWIKCEKCLLSLTNQVQFEMKQKQSSCHGDGEGHLTPIRRAISMEQMGSAIIRSYFCISSAEMITPTLPRVSAMMCSSTPAKHTHTLNVCVYNDHVWWCISAPQWFYFRILNTIWLQKWIWSETCCNNKK